MTSETTVQPVSHPHELAIADQRWTLTCSPTARYRSAEGFRQAPWIMLAGGLGLTLLIAVLVHSLAAQVRQRLRVEQALRASEQRLRVVFSQSPDILMTGMSRPPRTATRGPPSMPQTASRSATLAPASEERPPCR